ncbi:MAG: lamin tail domain-containing protein [Anaerolineaceae bacterium]|nr:lamin tail domain-containing protein [Anaerolineaceae bacterium]
MFFLVLVAGLLLSGLGLVQAAAPDLFFSEYIEGSSNNKALEIYNGTGAPVDLAAGGYDIQMFFNGNPIATLTINLVGTVAPGDVFVIAHSSAVAEILAQADQTNGAGWFNGDDAVVLRKGAVVIDSIGQSGFDPGTEWGTDLVSTADNTLRRKPDICQGDTNNTDVFDPALEWDGFAQNTFDGLGVHSESCDRSPFFSEYIEGSSNNKALEIYNPTSSPINLAADGYNVQMFFNGSSSAGLTISLVGVVAPGDVFVLAHSSAAAEILAVADQTNGAGWFNGDDAVVLLKGADVLDVIGQIGFDPGTEWGAGLVSTADNTLRRKSPICSGDTDGSDPFDPAVEWDGFATNTFDGLGSHTATCGGVQPVTDPSGVGAASPAAVEAGESTLLTVAVTPGTNPTSTGLTVTANLSAIGGSAAQSFFDDGSNGDAIAGDNVFSYLVTVPAGTAPASYALPASITDAQARGASAAINLKVVMTAAINQIQGAAHISPLAGQDIGTQGIVTALAGNGFWIQSVTPDSDEATSEGLFIFTNSSPSVAVGDAVRVIGRVSEFRPGGISTGNLTITELSSNPVITILSSGNALPAPTIIGNGGRIPPSAVINDDGSGNVEDQPPATFDAAYDGIDFYESLEGMLVQVNDAIVVGPTNRFGETWVVGDNGANAGLLTARGGINIAPNDFNPERIQLEDDLYPGTWSALNVGAHLTTPVVGVVDYNFGNFEVKVTQLFTADTATEAAREVTALAGSDSEVTIATFNVENLPGDASAAEFASRANQIVNNLGSPDIVVLEEMQDNNGTTNDGTTDATVTFNNLIDAIQTAGGPAYAFTQINPTDGEDGGAPGGNIRVGFLYNPARITFNTVPGDATTANSVMCTDGAPVLNLNPGRIDPTNIAFFDSRKPLVGQFEFNGEQIFVVGVHFNSKGGDQPLFGFNQPPFLGSEAQRLQQAQVVNDFVDSILSCAPNASVIVLGDMNDFQFSTPVATVKGGVLNNLFDLLPANEQYSYVFDGNSQVLDQMVVSGYLFNNASPAYDVVHVNSEFSDQVSDHDPSVSRFLPVVPVGVDVRPFNPFNLINLHSNAKVPVAILSTADFNAGYVDPTTVTFAGASVATSGQGRLHYQFRDVNWDHRLDIVLYFETQDMSLNSGILDAVLAGETLSGTKFSGTDRVLVIGNSAPILQSPEDGSIVNLTRPTLRWSPVFGAACYLVQVDDEPGFNEPLVQESTVVFTPRYRAFPLANGLYYWRVQVGGTCNITPGPWSETWSFTVAP